MHNNINSWGATVTSEGTFKLSVWDVWTDRSKQDTFYNLLYPLLTSVWKFCKCRVCGLSVKWCLFYGLNRWLGRRLQNTKEFSLMSSDTRLWTLVTRMNWVVFRSRDITKNVWSTELNWSTAAECSWMCREGKSGQNSDTAHPSRTGTLSACLRVEHPPWQWMI